MLFNNAKIVRQMFAITLSISQNLQYTKKSPSSYYFFCLERLQPHQNKLYANKLLNNLQNISTQCSGYLKTLFFSVTTKYDTEHLLPHTIKSEARKARINAHPQNSLPGKGVA